MCCWGYSSLLASHWLSTAAWFEPALSSLFITALGLQISIAVPSLQLLIKMKILKSTIFLFTSISNFMYVSRSYNIVRYCISFHSTMAFVQMTPEILESIYVIDYPM